MNAKACHNLMFYKIYILYHPSLSPTFHSFNFGLQTYSAPFLTLAFESVL